MILAKFQQVPAARLQHTKHRTSAVVKRFDRIMYNSPLFRYEPVSPNPVMRIVKHDLSELRSLSTLVDLGIIHAAPSPCRSAESAAVCAALLTQPILTIMDY